MGVAKIVRRLQFSGACVGIITLRTVTSERSFCHVTNGRVLYLADKGSMYDITTCNECNKKLCFGERPLHITVRV